MKNRINKDYRTIQGRTKTAQLHTFFKLVTTSMKPPKFFFLVVPHQFVKKSISKCEAAPATYTTERFLLKLQNSKKKISRIRTNQSILS